MPTLAAGVAADFWSHPNAADQADLLNGFELIDIAQMYPRADLARRAQLADIPVIGPAVADHIGNFGFSSALMIPLTAFGFALTEYGHSIDNEIVAALGEIIPVAGLLAVAAINLSAEGFSLENTQFLVENTQFAGDVLFGIGGAFLTHLATQGALERFQTKKMAATFSSPVIN